MINIAVKNVVTALCLVKQELLKKHVGNYSLRVGGAMAMNLNDIDQKNIKKMESWSTGTFLMYIHEQISSFSTEVYKQMSNPIVFQNINFQLTNGSTVNSPAV